MGIPLNRIPPQDPKGEDIEFSRTSKTVSKNARPSTKPQTPSRQRSKPQPPQQKTQQSAQPKNVAQPSPKQSLPKSKKGKEFFYDEDGKKWGIDAKTGKKFRVLPSADPELIKANKASNGAGVPLEMLQQFHEEIDDFDDDLNKAADLFLAHLRVPPSPEEMEQARQERIRKAQARREEKQF